MRGRAAARCNKGIEVLLAVALEHFVLVVVRVLRGPSQADESARKLRRLLHCQWCEARLFLRQGNVPDGGWLRGRPSPWKRRTANERSFSRCLTAVFSADALPCTCHRSLPGRTAVQLGPLW